ncbi:MAG TPA: PASTA domain-containing protein [Longimicrobiales bacterium]|nr:PASTA domain-containing protein [Longimicrobiales bacterium]
MKLGSSLRKHRGGARRGAGKGGASRGGGSGGAASLASRMRLAGSVLLLALAGWGLGYLVATRIVYPAPPPPTNLVPVPDLRGQSVAEGEANLIGAGLALGAVDSLLHPTVLRGLILGQTPLPGQVAIRGSEVRVTRSLGPQTRAVPDVRNVDASRALVILETVGLLVVVDSVDSEVPRGRVVSTNPSAGSVVGLPSQIRLSVSRGPAQVLMPYLLGMEEGAAVAALDSLGLVVGAVEEVDRDGRDAGLVVDQQPPADTPVERGSAVRLAVGRRGG